MATTRIIHNSYLHAVAGVDHIGLGGDYAVIYNLRPLVEEYIALYCIYRGTHIHLSCRRVAGVNHIWLGGDNAGYL